MTARQLTVATWNIGGGILGASHQRTAVPSLSHHVCVLTTHQPDVICLQEAHEFGDRSGQTQELAARAGFAHAVWYPVSPSHLVDGAQLALGVLSRFPLRGFTFRSLPAPRLEATGPGGEPWVLHDKGYLVGRIQLPDGDVSLVNGHFFPLHRFGVSPADPQFTPLCRQFTLDLLALSAAGPTLAGIDLNHSSPGEVLGEALLPGRLTNAIADTPTTPDGSQRDYLLHDDLTRVLGTHVVPTRSDHFYCQVSVLV